ncbi:hypothetical protein M758_1G167300 [Ceratodon purpureus]|uniref:J domain-containing protein n=1 Tax=Ceratodon purpureus TaxID=3225 RepID=A0A8T0GU17_CERPU|nr:hypothetical protein KC19_9G042200 [Ceratodon purpureus]KAG0561160.1 hypothetical protein KC19_9G042200 [Ceratodon purpureus]KAG0561162.1 hypothetical protein KC19_9G042200 [Ceratodon purpureus]KAG0561164.1 hypothetical protein KC19_9G042200 [Ceratodon purpureus]KAG0561167.1 hypothetical protein KC19_9G042200 [Ceratodon purpureus]
MFALRNRAAGLALRAPELCNGGARMSTRALGPDEWWAVDGEILRIRPDFSKGYTRVNMKEPDPRPKPLNYRKLFADRMTRMSLIRIRDNSQEGYWDSYMERFNQTREEWEKLYWDGAPRAPDQDPIAMRPIDHYQILGLRKRHQPYSPIELKAAFRDKALLFHPENNREKDPKKRAANMAKFRQVWESYKNLQNRRSW